MKPTEAVVPVIDLFAGPGGLGEGFESLESDISFRNVLSVEKDRFAYATLKLRAFFRQFPRGKAPEDYYRYLLGEIDREQLFTAYPDAVMRTRAIVWGAELGSPSISSVEVDGRIATALDERRPWVLIGGPPCQAYSVAGRSRMGRADVYREDGRHQLYRHYLRIIARHGPDVFVMENVKGLLSSKLDNTRIYDQLMMDLAEPCQRADSVDLHGATDPPLAGYRIMALSEPSVMDDLFQTYSARGADYLVEAERHGIPQARHRVFLLGVRMDRYPGRLGSLPSRSPVSVDAVISDLPGLRSRLSRESDSASEWAGAIQEQLDALAVDEVNPAVLERMRAASGQNHRYQEIGGRFLPGEPSPRTHADWYVDPRLGGFLNHETRSHMRSDLLRYLFAACYAEQHRVSPKLHEFPEELLPRHKNVHRALKSRHDYFTDRFRVQLADEPARTVTAHIARDGHYFIHPDPTQCRSLTVREAARLQTFPDNYFFEGPRTEQYVQVGNAVPPLLARQIAKIVAGILGAGESLSTTTGECVQTDV